MLSQTYIHTELRVQNEEFLLRVKILFLLIKEKEKLLLKQILKERF